MTTLREVRQLWQKTKNEFSPVRRTRTAVLGDGQGNLDVPNGPEFVWARDTVESNLSYPTLNRLGVARIYDLPVLLGYLDEEPNIEQILRVYSEGLGSTTPITSVPTTPLHHQQHELGGGDEIYIDERQLKTGLIQPTDPASLYVTINRFVYYYRTYQKFDETTSQSLGEFLPDTGYKVFLLMAFDPHSESVVYRRGFPYAVDSLEDTFVSFDAVPPPSGDEYPLGYMLLESTTTEITFDNLFSGRLLVQTPYRRILERLDQLEGYTGNDPSIALTGAANSIGSNYQPRLGNLLDVAVSSVTNGQTIVYETSTKRWIPGTSSSGGGATSFIQLVDVPASYTGASGQAVVVNSTATGLEFAAGVDIGSNAASVQSINFIEQSSGITTPDTSHRSIYAKTDGIYEVNSAGTVVGPFGTRLILTTTGPSDVSGASALGTATSAAKGDHVHRGIQSVNVPGNALIFGPAYIESGTGTTVTQSGNSILISASGGGAGAAVSSINVVGATPLQASVYLIAGTGASLSQSGASITIGADTGSGAYNQGYIVVQDIQPLNVSGGTFTLGAWRTRTLNSLVIDTTSAASLAGCQLNLPVGTYRATIYAPAFAVDRHKARLQNTTTSATLLEGRSAYAAVAGAVKTDSVIVGRFVLSASANVEVQHQSAATFATRGFGVESNFTGTSEIYTVVELLKEL